MRVPRVIILLAVLAALPLLAVACGGGDDDNTDTASPTASASGEASAAPVGIDDLAHGVVQIFAIDENDDPVWSGSGTLISEDGLMQILAYVKSLKRQEGAQGSK